jgi:DNA-directed RNA polymerase subunit M/transcription elongation factor TFIIS
MEFCDICDNMLYIEYSDDKGLIEYCKNCNFIKDNDNISSKIIIDSSTNNNTNIDQHINKFIKYDKTIPRVNHINCKNKNCTKKPEEENNILFIKYNNIDLKYIYFCHYCDFYWSN